jgi:hypothetical protein
MCRSSDIWVTECNYVESVTFVRKCFTVGSLDEIMMNLHLYNKIFYLEQCMGFLSYLCVLCVVGLLMFLESVW